MIKTSRKSCLRMLTKGTAVFVCLAFLVTSVYLPQARAEVAPIPALNFRSLTDDLTAIALPKEIGKIQETFRGSGDKVVVLVQDAHSIPDAQHSIRSAIDYFQTKYGISLVGLEGASEKLDPQIFRSFPDKELLRKTFEAYAQRGELTGGTAAALFNTSPGTYHGIEDWPLYEEGVSYYLQATAMESEIKILLEPMEAALSREKETVYSKELLEIDRLLSDFGGNKTDLVQVLNKLNQYQPPPKGSELAVLLEEILQSQMTDTPVEIEIKKIAGQLEVALKERSLDVARDDLRVFNQKYQEFKTAQVTPQAFAFYLKGLAKKHGVRVKVSRKLAYLTEHQKRLKDIEGTRLFEDFKRYADSVKESLFQNEEQKALDIKTRGLDLIKRLTRLELSFEDWEKVQELTLQLDQWTVTQDQIVSREEVSALLKKMEPHLTFYHVAEKRDKVFLENIQSMMAKEKQESSMLIAGGFHTEGLTKELKEKRISYVLVMPRIGSIPEEPLYREHMQGQVSWSNYFEVKDGKVNLYDAFVRATRDHLMGISSGAALNSLEDFKQDQGRATRDKLLGDKNASTTGGKEWRDQIIRDLANAGRITEAGDYTRFIDELTDPQLRTPNPELQALREQWLANIDRFGEGLKKLQTEGTLSESSILQLIKTITIPEPVSMPLAKQGVSSALFPSIRDSESPSITQRGRPETRRSESRQKDLRQVMPGREAAVKTEINISTSLFEKIKSLIERSKDVFFEIHDSYEKAFGNKLITKTQDGSNIDAQGLDLLMAKGLLANPVARNNFQTKLEEAIPSAGAEDVRNILNALTERPGGYASLTDEQKSAVLGAFLSAEIIPVADERTGPKLVTVSQFVRLHAYAQEYFFGQVAVTEDVQIKIITQHEFDTRFNDHPNLDRLAGIYVRDEKTMYLPPRAAASLGTAFQFYFHEMGHHILNVTGADPWSIEEWMWFANRDDIRKLIFEGICEAFSYATLKRLSEIFNNTDHPSIDHGFDLAAAFQRLVGRSRDNSVYGLGFFFTLAVREATGEAFPMIGLGLLRAAASQSVSMPDALMAVSEAVAIMGSPSRQAFQKILDAILISGPSVRIPKSLWNRISERIRPVSLKTETAGFLRSHPDAVRPIAMVIADILEKAKKDRALELLPLVEILAEQDPGVTEALAQAVWQSFLHCEKESIETYVRTLQALGEKNKKTAQWLTHEIMNLELSGQCDGSVAPANFRSLGMIDITDTLREQGWLTRESDPLGGILLRLKEKPDFERFKQDFKTKFGEKVADISKILENIDRKRQILRAAITLKQKISAGAVATPLFPDQKSRSETRVKSADSDLAWLIESSNMLSSFTTCSTVDDLKKALLENTAGFMTIQNFVKTKARQVRGGYSLGLSTGYHLYLGWSRVCGLTDWMTVYAEEKIGVVAQGHTATFLNQITNDNKPIVFFVPDGMRASGVTRDEMNWIAQKLQSEPGLLRNILFVFGAYNTYFSSADLQFLTSDKASDDLIVTRVLQDLRSGMSTEEIKSLEGDIALNITEYEKRREAADRMRKLADSKELERISASNEFRQSRQTKPPATFSASPKYTAKMVIDELRKLPQGGVMRDGREYRFDATQGTFIVYAQNNGFTINFPTPQGFYAFFLSSSSKEDYAQAKKLLDELSADSRPEASPPARSESRTSWTDSTTDPGQYKKGDAFRFIVHAVQNGAGYAMRSMFAAREGLEVDPSRSINLLQQPQRIPEKTMISTSYIDQDHRATWGAAGFILKVPEGNILETHAQDAGTPFFGGRDAVVEKLRNRSLQGPDELLAGIMETTYNEVLITGTHPNHPNQRVELQGVFLKVLPSGEYVADQETVRTFKQLAARHALPVIEIPEPFIAYKASGKAEAFISNTLNLATMKHDGKSYAVALNKGQERYLVSKEVGEFGQRMRKSVLSNGGVSSRPMADDEYQKFLEEIKPQLPSNPTLQEVFAKLTGIEAPAAFSTDSEGQRPESPVRQPAPAKQNAITEVLSAPDFEPKRLIEVLRNKLSLGPRYSMPVGVWKRIANWFKPKSVTQVSRDVRDTGEAAVTLEQALDTITISASAHLEETLKQMGLPSDVNFTMKLREVRSAEQLPANLTESQIFEIAKGITALSVNRAEVRSESRAGMLDKTKDVLRKYLPSWLLQQVETGQSVATEPPSLNEIAKALRKPMETLPVDIARWQMLPYAEMFRESFGPTPYTEEPTISPEMARWLRQDVASQVARAMGNEGYQYAVQNIFDAFVNDRLAAAGLIRRLFMQAGIFIMPEFYSDGSMTGALLLKAESLSDIKIAEIDGAQVLLFTPQERIPVGKVGSDLKDFHGVHLSGTGIAIIPGDTSQKDAEDVVLFLNDKSDQGPFFSRVGDVQKALNDVDGILAARLGQVQGKLLRVAFPQESGNTSDLVRNKKIRLSSIHEIAHVLNDLKGRRNGNKANHREEMSAVLQELASGESPHLVLANKMNHILFAEDEYALDVAQAVDAMQDVLEENRARERLSDIKDRKARAVALADRLDLLAAQEPAKITAAARQAFEEVFGYKPASIDLSAFVSLDGGRARSESRERTTSEVTPFNVYSLLSEEIKTLRADMNDPKSGVGEVLENARTGLSQYSAYLKALGERIVRELFGSEASVSKRVASVYNPFGGFDPTPFIMFPEAQDVYSMGIEGFGPSVDIKRALRSSALSDYEKAGGAFDGYDRIQDLKGAAPGVMAITRIMGHLGGNIQSIHYFELMEGGGLRYLREDEIRPFSITLEYLMKELGINESESQALFTKLRGSREGGYDNYIDENGFATQQFEESQGRGGVFYGMPEDLNKKYDYKPRDKLIGILKRSLNKDKCDNAVIAFKDPNTGTIKRYWYIQNNVYSGMVSPKQLAGLESFWPQLVNAGLIDTKGVVQSKIEEGVEALKELGLDDWRRGRLFEILSREYREKKTYLAFINTINFQAMLIKGANDMWNPDKETGDLNTVAATQTVFEETVVPAKRNGAFVVSDDRLIDSYKVKGEGQKFHPIGMRDPQSIALDYSFGYNSAGENVWFWPSGWLKSGVGSDSSGVALGSETTAKALAPVLKPGGEGVLSLNRAEVRAIYEVTVRGERDALITTLKQVVEEQMANTLAKGAMPEAVAGVSAEEMVEKIRGHQKQLFDLLRTLPKSTISVGLMMDAENSQSFLAQFVKALGQVPGVTVEVIAPAKILNDPALKVDGLQKRPVRGFNQGMVTAGENSEVPLAIDPSIQNQTGALAEMFRAFRLDFKDVGDNPLMRDDIVATLAGVLLASPQIMEEDGYKKCATLEAKAAYLKGRLEDKFGIKAMFGKPGADGSLTLIGSVVQDYVAHIETQKAA